MCYDRLTLGYLCREGLARQVGELGGETELLENSLAIRDFRAGASLQGSLNSRKYICHEAQPDLLHPPSHSPTVAFGHCGRGAFCHC